MKLKERLELDSSILKTNKNRQISKESMKSFSLDEMKDKYIGEVGTIERDEYEYELRMDLLSSKESGLENS